VTFAVAALDVLTSRLMVLGVAETTMVLSLVLVQAQFAILLTGMAVLLDITYFKYAMLNHTKLSPLHQAVVCCTGVVLPVCGWLMFGGVLPRIAGGVVSAVMGVVTYGLMMRTMRWKGQSHLMWAGQLAVLYVSVHVVYIIFEYQLSVRVLLTLWLASSMLFCLVKVDMRVGFTTSSHASEGAPDMPHPPSARQGASSARAASSHSQHASMKGGEMVTAL